MKINFTKLYRRKLAKLGFTTKVRGKKYVEKLKLEMPILIDSKKFKFFASLEIGAFTSIRENVQYYTPTKIGRFCSIAEDVKIGLIKHDINEISTSHFFNKKEFMPFLTKKIIDIFSTKIEIKGVEIGNDVWIQNGVKISDGVKIGTGAVLLSGAFVNRDVEPYSFVGGIPARPLLNKDGTKKMRPVQIDFARTFFEYYDLPTPCVLTEEDLHKMQFSFKRIIKNFINNFKN